jgi:hypothetical protein
MRKLSEPKWQVVQLLQLGHKVFRTEKHPNEQCHWVSPDTRPYQHWTVQSLIKDGLVEYQITAPQQAVMFGVKQPEYPRIVYLVLTEKGREYRH